MKKILIKLLCSNVGKAIFDIIILPVIRDEINDTIGNRINDPNLKIIFSLYMQTEFTVALRDKIINKLKS